MFYIALLFIIIGGFLFVFERGGYNIMRYSFRKAKFFTKGKEEEMITNLEGRKNDKEILYKTYSFPLTYPILLSGVITAVLSTCISFTI